MRSWPRWPSVILGRTGARISLAPGTDEVIVARRELIDERRADAVESAGVPTCQIRSPALTCEAEEGVCATGYGARPCPRDQGEHRRGRRHIAAQVDR